MNTESSRRLAMSPIANVDRSSHLREKINQIDRLWTQPDSLTLIWHEGLFLVNQGKLCQFPFTDIEQRTASLGKPTYLGQAHQSHWFCCRAVLPDDFQNDGEWMSLRRSSLLADDLQLELMMYAQGMMNWQQRHRYCSYCGSRTQLIQAGHARLCHDEQCGKTLYPKIDPAVIFSIINNNGAESKILLARQPHWEPMRFSIIAGFVETGETLEQAVRREAMEETGIQIDSVEYWSSQSWPFPDSLMLGFIAYTRDSTITLHDKELEQADWYSAEDVIKAVSEARMKLPFRISLSWYLIDRWFHQQTGYSLAQLDRDQS